MAVWRPLTFLGLTFLIVGLAVGDGDSHGDHGDGARTSNAGTKQSGRSDNPKRPNIGSKGRPDFIQGGSYSNGELTLSAGSFNVQIKAENGNLPFFRYWVDGDEGNKTRISFQRMFQTANPNQPMASSKLNPTNLVGGYNWAFSAPEDVSVNGSNTTDVRFDMTGIIKTGGGGPNAPKPNIKFVIHLLSNENGTEMKFDTHITNYSESWWHSSAQALVLAYKIQTGNDKDLELKQARLQRNATRPDSPRRSDGLSTPRQSCCEMGNGCGCCVDNTACSGSEHSCSNTGMSSSTVSVTVTAGIDRTFGDPPEIDTPGVFLYIAYSKFNQELHHDPTLYNQATSSSSINSPSSQTLYDANGNIVFLNGVVVTPILSGAASLKSSFKVVAALLMVVLVAVL